MSKALNLKGQKFGKLTVLERVGSNNNGQSLWKCKCECGNEIITQGHTLNSNNAKSCGCTRTEKIKQIRFKHGMSKTRLFTIWQGIKFRCHNPKFKDYNIYKGKGITICQEWDDSFLAFYNWAIANGYKDDLTIDRIDVNGNYEPANCRWVDNFVQANNRTNNRYVIYHNETDTMTNMCRRLNVNPKTIYGRMKNNRRTFQQAVDEFDKTPSFKEYGKKNAI